MLLVQAKDQILVSAVRTEPFRPNQPVEITDEEFESLEKSHPGFFEVVGKVASDSDHQDVSEQNADNDGDKPAVKAAPPAKNKVDNRRSNKSAPK